MPWSTKFCIMWLLVLGYSSEITFYLLQSVRLKLFLKIADKGKMSNSFYEATITLTPKPDKDATKKRKLQVTITDEHR